MQGGLTGTGDGGSGAVSVTSAGGAAPAATGSPTVADGSGVTVSSDVGEMNALNRLLAGTSYTHDDVQLALNLITTGLLLYAVLEGESL